MSLRGGTRTRSHWVSPSAAPMMAKAEAIQFFLEHWIASLALVTTGKVISPVLPFRFTLFDEGSDAFLGVAGHHVFGHYLCGIAVRVGQAHFSLPVERGLAEFHRVR